MKKTISIIIFIINSNIFATEIIPLFRFSYDYNLGFTYGLGACISNSMKDGGIYEGIYSMYTWSKKNAGTNISIGFQSGIGGMASGAYSINRMINSQNQTFWGLEYNPHVFIFDGKIGIMNKDFKHPFDIKNYKINTSIGLGLF